MAAGGDWCSSLSWSSPPRQSDKLWWQPLAETPTKGLVMKQAMTLNSRATWAQIWRKVVSLSAVRRASS